MPDVKPQEMDTLVDTSVNEQTSTEVDKETPAGNSEKEGLLKELKSEREKRHQMEARLADLESKLTAEPPKSSQDDVDLEVAVERLAPILQKKGFMTRQEREDEDRAEKYARDLESLSKKYDGKDGRPAFDPAEIANYAKTNGIFNLEAAYRDKHWSELVDWEKKQSDSENVVTERPSSTNPSRGERVKLTREFLEQRLNEPDGKEWYEKNRDKVLEAMKKGQL